ncbi:MAG: phosphoribosylformylglycinamidine synthase [Bacteroidales bacterium]|nr:phosphoribosylformylglycinamidine synthase [Bacteroidales bacterium]
MITFFRNPEKYFFVESASAIAKDDIQKLEWLFGEAAKIMNDSLQGTYVGARKEMVTPWSTNAVEITQNMGIEGIIRVEEFDQVQTTSPEYDPMLQAVYENPAQDVFTIEVEPEAIVYIDDMHEYNKSEGLALSEDEVEYLEDVAKQIGRKLTDSEVYGFAQVNSEHCRHKIFNGSFIIDGKEMPHSLFSMIKQTSKENHNKIVSAYKDNVAFISGPKAQQFAPKTQDKADFFEVKEMDTLISLKAETHNFPTTVEPFNGAATGSGGEIRDRMAGGKGSMPLAGTAVYMTSYPRFDSQNRDWEKTMKERDWLYQSPLEILIKASNGASDFGNKFGQPLINGSLLTFEHQENDRKLGYDKVIMQAGGIGYAKASDAQKDTPKKGDKVVVMGGDNYRIGMGGGAVSSVATGEFTSGIELNAVQRSNPEMQKRVNNAVRAMCESDVNPIVSIHDHGAGGHLNSLSELVEETGGTIHLEELPVGDPTLSAKEIIGNESQERMGLVINEKDVEMMQRVSERERAPFYVVGDITGDMHFKFESKKQDNPIDLELGYLFGKPPKTVLVDTTIVPTYKAVNVQNANFEEQLSKVLRIEAVASKDWLTNKVDRSVTGKVAKQQCAGSIQLPLNDVGVMAMDYQGIKGIATTLGHAPISALVDEGKGSRLSIAEALTNMLWAPIEDNIKGLSLSANWMWPAKNEGENARLYKGVEAIGKFAIDLGINVPTGKDSLSMKQKYDDGVVYSPGTVIITAVGEVSDIRKVVEPVIQEATGSKMVYVDFSKTNLVLGGSSFAQVNNQVGADVPDVADTTYFKNAFNAVQKLVEQEQIIAGHDISAGGIITTLLEMTFAQNELGLNIDLSSIDEKDLIKLLFSENPGAIMQVKDIDAFAAIMNAAGISFHQIGEVNKGRILNIKHNEFETQLGIDKYRDIWFETSYFFEQNQTANGLAEKRYENYKTQELSYRFPQHFNGKLAAYVKDTKKPKAAIIREKGVNGDREMAYSLYHAGFDVKDVHMTDLIAGREDLSDVNMIVYVGGFSNSDVLGSAKGWAGAFLYNEKAKAALDAFYARKDTLSLGICNGCQLMVELGLVYPNMEVKPKMLHNDSHKFESGFINVEIQENDSVMLNTLAGSRLGVWVAHGEGKFRMMLDENEYHIPVKYAYEEYPANPNGSDHNAAAIVSKDGRHLAMMPHLERAIFNWQWANYPADRKADEVTPWFEAFVNAREWVEEMV